MKRKRLFFSAISLFLITSCTFVVAKAFTWSLYANDSYAITLLSKKLKNYPLDYNEDGYTKIKDEIEEIITNKGDVYALNSKFGSFNEYAEQSLSRYYVCEAFYSGDPTSDFYKEKRDYFYSMFLDYRNHYSHFRILASTSSDEIKKYFFGTTDSEEISRLISGDEKTKKYNELNTKMEDVVDRMRLLASDPSITDSVYIDKSIDLYLEYIPFANEVAELYEYDNYLDYSYENDFDRDYEPSDGLFIAEYIKEHILPVYSSFVPTKGSGYSENLYNKINSYNLANRSTNLGDVFTNYMSTYPSDYYNIYNSLWNNGYYYFSNNESLGTAFTAPLYEKDTQLLFFGSDYQNVTTVVHEFGHYMALTANTKNSDKPLDIKETHSQSNEFLFANYLNKQNLGDTYSYFCQYKLKNSLTKLLNFAYIIEIENYAFTTEYSKLTKESFKNKLNELRNEYDNLVSRTYWAYPCVSSSCYYISYLTSLMVSLELYEDELEAGKQKYINFISDTIHNKCVECWESAGFSSPFTEEAYINLANYIREIS